MAVVITAMATVVGGRLVGYSEAGAYLLFGILAALVTAAAWVFATRSFDMRSRSDAIVRAGVIAFAIISGCGLLLGAAGRLTAPWWIAAESVCVAGALFLRPRRSAAGRVQLSFPPAAIAIAGALLTFAAAFALTHAPLTLYDSVSYHLFFAARWVQEHRLSIVPTPFSDEAQAYAPANGELFFVWLMIPFHGDLLARAGQFPFALLSAVTLYALARRLGAPRDHAIYPAAFFLLARPIVEQAIGSDVDLVCAAMFLASLYLGAAAVESNLRRDWGLWGVSLGLYLGSKYIALVYTPIFLIMAAVPFVPSDARPGPPGSRWRMMWTVPGILAFAAPWYLRNWIAGGSPIYPATLALGPLTIARGAFSRAAMLHTVFHTSNLRLLPAIVAHAFGASLAIWLPLAVVGGVRMIRTGWWPSGFLALVPVAAVVLFWIGCPVNVDSRFLLPAVGAALLPFAFTFGRSPKSDRLLHVLYAMAMVWLIAGAPVDIGPRLPWYMQGWLTFDGIVGSEFLFLFAAVAAILGCAWWAARRQPRWALAITVSLCAASAAVLAVGGDRWCPPLRCEYIDASSPRIRPNLLIAWRWVAENTKNSTIAYTGINLPYPLTGDRLTNRVVYANIDGRAHWRFHDYDRAYRRGRFDPRPPALATSSGELLPVAARRGPRDDAMRPRYERMEGFEYAWIDNLRQLKVDYLFVSALSAYEVDYVWHNDRDYPIEDEWAKANPRVFRLVYENRQVRIYSVHPREVNPT